MRDSFATFPHKSKKPSDFQAWYRRITDELRRRQRDYGDRVVDIDKLMGE